MHTIQHSTISPYSAQQLFALVDAIEDYPAFLPWCKATQVLSRTATEVRATLHLSRAGIDKSFTTHNHLKQDQEIVIELVEGPFKHLEGLWHFNQLNAGQCQISLDLKFEFSSRLLEFALGPVFHQIGTSLIHAFCQRAEQIYGKK